MRIWGKIQESIDKARQTIRWCGPWRACALIARVALRPLVDWQIYYVAENDVESEARRAVPAEANFPVRIFTLEHGVDRVASELAPILACEPADVAKRLHDGDAVAIAYHGEVVIGCCWAAFRRKVGMPMKTAWRIGPGEAVLYRSFVLPKWRGQRVHRSLDVALNTYMLEHGIRRTLASMSALNPQTLSLAKRNGKAFVMTLVLVQVPLLGWTWRYATGRPLHTHFEAVPQLPRREENGEPGGTRTRDHRIKSAMLYQLSYRPSSARTNSGRV